jgi:uroporphyrinogen decarboxylase
MDSKERFDLALRKQLPDRLPMDLIWPRAETIVALKAHFGTESEEEVRCRLGIDFRWLGIPTRYPDFARRVNGRLEGEAPGAGQDYVFRDRQTFEDAWGIVRRVGDDGKYVEWCGGPLVGREDLAGWDLPSVIYPSVGELARHIRPFRDFVTVIEIEFPFKVAWHLCGMEDFLVLMLTNPKFVHGLYDRLYAFQEEKALLAVRAGFDVIAVVGDIAGQLGMMFSPSLFRQFDIPRFKSMVSKLKAENPQVKVLYHSDGNPEAVIPLLIECGIDILNPIQSACMDPADIKRRYGDRLTFHGTISVQDTIPYGTVEDVRNEVFKRIRTVGYDGGLVVSPENSIPFDAPLENVLAVYDAVRTFDYGSL